MSTPISAMMHSAARLPDAGDRVEPVTGLSERGDHPVDLDVEGGDRRFEVVDVVDDDPQHRGVVLAEPAAQRLAQHAGSSCAAPPWPSRRARSGSRSPAIRARSIARPDTPSTSEATESSLIPASSSTFCTRCHSAVWVWINRLR